MKIKDAYSVYENSVKIILFCLLLLLLFGYCTAKIGDGDFWWHLKQGEWMVKNHSLLQSDPFSYTSAQVESYSEQLRQRFNMTQYWLSDIIFYLVYFYYGITGNIILRAALYVLLLILVIMRMKLLKVNFHIAFFLAGLMGYVLITYIGDRPQIVSFFAGSALILLLQDLNKKLQAGKYYSYSVIAIPLLMLLWANLHGGFIMGIFILFVSLVSEISKNLIKKYTGREPGQIYHGRTLNIYAAVSLTAIAVSFINPNTYKVIPLLLDLETSIFVATIDEYFSVIKFMQYVSPRPLIIFLIMTIPTAVLMLKSRRADLTDVLLFISLGAVSFYSVRFLVFFSVWTIPLMGAYISHEWENFFSLEKWQGGFLRFLGRTRFLEIIILIFFLHVFISNVRGDIFFRFGVHDTEIFPARAVKFIKNNHPKPNMFNNLLSGGYLMWELYPEYLVFMDGRTFSKKTYNDHARIIWAVEGQAGGQPGWKELLDIYKVNFILTFSLEPHTGRLYKFIPALIGSNNWRLVYMDDYSLVFVRDKGENREIIKKFGIPNEFGWNEAIMEASRGIRREPHNIQYYITMGDAFFGKRDYRNALGIYTRAGQIDSKHPVVLERLALLRRFGY